MSGGNSSNKGNDSNDDRGRLGSKFLKVARATLTVAKEVTAAAAITIGSVAVIGLIAGMTETEEATAVAADGLSTFLIMAGLILGLYALRKYLSSTFATQD
ncbi:hypothetical protein RIF29_16127 [Crotalaria pallida]|uniref:Uncharacterized protein n=1 Tax=Crotalaria pallida TaxID=3830 RepID=A0AAN9IJK9_CROPI